MDQIFGLLADPKVLAILSPLLVAALKKGVGTLPSWAHPVLSVILGAALSAVAGGDLSTGAGAGLVGIGVRELVDQGKQAVTTSPAA